MFRSTLRTSPFLLMLTFELRIVPRARPRPERAREFDQADGALSERQEGPASPERRGN